MSGGISCKDRAHKPEWRVVDRCCNYSKYNGRRYTPSEYSALVCLTCHASWRSKGDYVDRVHNISKEEHDQWLRPT